MWVNVNAPLHVIPLVASVYPVPQLHWKDPAVLMQPWAQPPLLELHSLMSETMWRVIVRITSTNKWTYDIKGQTYNVICCRVTSCTTSTNKWTYDIKGQTYNVICRVTSCTTIKVPVHTRTPMYLGTYHCNQVRYWQDCILSHSCTRKSWLCLCMSERSLHCCWDTHWLELKWINSCQSNCKIKQVLVIMYVCIAALKLVE